MQLQYEYNLLGPLDFARIGLRSSTPLLTSLQPIVSKSEKASNKITSSILCHIKTKREMIKRNEIIIVWSKSKLSSLITVSSSFCFCCVGNSSLPGAVACRPSAASNPSGPLPPPPRRIYIRIQPGPAPLLSSPRLIAYSHPKPPASPLRDTALAASRNLIPSRSHQTDPIE